MVESFFGLARRPFCVAPNLDSYVPTQACQTAVEHSLRCVLRAEGPSVIIAGAGLGKTICAMRIAQKLRESMQVVLLSSSQLCTRRALLQSILYHLELPYQATSEGTLRIQLQERLTQASPRSQGVVLVVDEAQTLSTKLLDEIRVLSNTLSQGKPVLHLVLIGTLKLEDTLSHPHMESLNQRIVSRQYLTPLNYQESLHYIRCKIELAGADPSSVFEPAAMDAIYRASDGVPRLIEQLADQAILQSGMQSQRPIPASRIGRVWSEVHQLPNPWSESESSPRDLSVQDSAVNQKEASSSGDPYPALGADSIATSEDISGEVYEPDASVEFGMLDEEPASVNLFRSFIEDPELETDLKDDSATPASATPASATPASATPASATPASATDTNENSEPICMSAPSAKDERSIIQALDETFRQLIRDLNLAAIQLPPSEHAFVRAEQSSKLSPKSAITAPQSVKTSPREIVGISVDGDDRDMIVLIEEQDWINPFAIR